MEPANHSGSRVDLNKIQCLERMCHARWCRILTKSFTRFLISRHGSQWAARLQTGTRLIYAPLSRRQSVGLHELTKRQRVDPNPLNRGVARGVAQGQGEGLDLKEGKGLDLKEQGGERRDRRKLRRGGRDRKEEERGKEGSGLPDWEELNADVTKGTKVLTQLFQSSWWGWVFPHFLALGG